MRIHHRPGRASQTAARICRALCLGLIAAAMATGAVQGQNPVPIINLHHNTSNGIPAAPYTIGTAVTVRGVLTAGVGIFTSDYLDIYVQDATAGIDVFKSGAPPYAFQIGDSVTINGTIGQYRGLTEVVMTSYTLYGPPGHVPQPLGCTDAIGDRSFADQLSKAPPGRVPGRIVRLDGRVESAE